MSQHRRQPEPAPSAAVERIAVEAVKVEPASSRLSRRWAPRRSVVALDVVAIVRQLAAVEARRGVRRSQPTRRASTRWDEAAPVAAKPMEHSASLKKPASSTRPKASSDRARRSNSTAPAKVARSVEVSGVAPTSSGPSPASPPAQTRPLRRRKVAAPSPRAAGSGAPAGTETKPLRRRKVAVPSPSSGPSPASPPAQSRRKVTTPLPEAPAEEARAAEVSGVAPASSGPSPDSPPAQSRPLRRKVAPPSPEAVAPGAPAGTETKPAPSGPCGVEQRSSELGQRRAWGAGAARERPRGAVGEPRGSRRGAAGGPLTCRGYPQRQTGARRLVAPPRVFGGAVLGAPLPGASAKSYVARRKRRARGVRWPSPPVRAGRPGAPGNPTPERPPPVGRGRHGAPGPPSDPYLAT